MKQLVKDYLKDKTNMECKIKTHVRLKSEDYKDKGITGFYTLSELLKFYSDCECEIEEYEKDYGELDQYYQPIILKMCYLVVYADTDYDKQILNERG